MIPLVIAILLLAIAIVVSRNFILIKEWLIWACIVADIYMKDGVEAAKSKVLRKAVKRRFPIMICFLPDKVIQQMIGEIESDIEILKNSMFLYFVLIHGVNYYSEDYSYILRLIEDEGKREKA